MLALNFVMLLSCGNSQVPETSEHFGLDNSGELHMEAGVLTVQVSTGRNLNLLHAREFRKCPHFIRNCGNAGMHASLYCLVWKGASIYFNVVTDLHFDVATDCAMNPFKTRPCLQPLR